MDQDRARRASDTIWRHWQDGTVMDALDTDLAPASRADGYAIQAGLEAFSKQPRAGWKIAATSEAGQKHINVDGPLAGRLLTERLADDGAEFSIEGNRMRVCEPEFGFRFARDIAPRETPYTVDEVMAATGDLHPTFELPDSRYTDFTVVGAAALIADDACARDLMVGPAASADWRSMDLARHKVSASVEGRIDREGTGATVLGDPRVALTWLVNEVGSLGITIRAGELVTTGTCMIPLALEPGDRVTADYGALGQLSMTVSS